MDLYEIHLFLSVRNIHFPKQIMCLRKCVYRKLGLMINQFTHFDVMYDAIATYSISIISISIHSYL